MPIVWVIFCYQPPIRFERSHGGRWYGAYEIYLCKNTFDINYAIGEHDDQGKNQLEKFMTRQVDEIKTNYGYTQHETLSRSLDKEPPHYGLGPHGIHVDWRRVRFSGGRPKLPKTNTGANVFLYLTFGSHRHYIHGDYVQPAFLAEGQKIHLDEGYNERYVLSFYINVCRNDQLSVYAISPGSQFSYRQGKLTFERGGALACPAWPNDHPGVDWKSRFDCDDKLITEIE